MVSTVYKELIHLSDLKDTLDLQLPAFCEILTIAKQYDEQSVSMWYRCAPDAGKVPTRIHVVGTGYPCPVKHEAPYISTVIFGDGSLVLHFFHGGHV
jgi:hypothetical protein